MNKLQWLSESCNTGLNQIKEMYELCDNDFILLIHLIEQLRNLHIPGIPSTKEDLDNILKKSPSKQWYKIRLEIGDCIQVITEEELLKSYPVEEFGKEYYSIHDSIRERRMTIPKDILGKKVYVVATNIISDRVFVEEPKKFFSTYTHSHLKRWEDCTDVIMFCCIKDIRNVFIDT